MADADKRKSPRRALAAMVDCTGREVLLNHPVENISLGGMCIRLAADADPDAVESVGVPVDLVIRFGDSDASVAVQGEVVWCNREPPPDMGIRFVDLDDERREALRRILSEGRRRST